MNIKAVVAVVALVAALGGYFAWKNKRIERVETAFASVLCETDIMTRANEALLKVRDTPVAQVKSDIAALAQEMAGLLKAKHVKESDVALLESRTQTEAQRRAQSILKKVFARCPDTSLKNEQATGTAVGVLVAALAMQ
jgi:hypothetical protein